MSVDYVICYVNMIVSVDYVIWYVHLIVSVCYVIWFVNMIVSIYYVIWYVNMIASVDYVIWYVLLRVSEISLSCTFCRCLILFLTFISSCVLFDSYVLLADDHVNNVSYFPFMSIKKVIPYFWILREGYYVIIWLIVRNCVFVKYWKLIYSDLFILKRISMENGGGGGQLT
jgi:hypothetical protein